MTKDEAQTAHAAHQGEHDHHRDQIARLKPIIDSNQFTPAEAAEFDFHHVEMNRAIFNMDECRIILGTKSPRGGRYF